MKIYEIKYSIAEETANRLLANNSKDEAIKELKTELLEKYNFETVENLVIYQIILK